MDLHLIEAAPTAEERTAVDAVLGAADGGWDGGERRPLDGHIAYGGLRSAEAQRHHLLPALHALQDEVGWVSPGGLGYICRRLSIPPAEAYGVAGFYALLATEERPSRVAHVCDDISCRLAAGAGDSVVASGGAATPDGAMVLPSPCLGACDRGSAVFLQFAGEARRVAAPAPEGVLADALAGPAGLPRLQPPAAPQVGRSAASTPLLDTVTGASDAFGYDALARAIELGPERILAELDASGLRGRGGAAFPVATKWRAVAGAAAPVRFVVCNADESEPGTFKDRFILEHHPRLIIEAMAIAGLTVGAERGFAYIRAEYPEAERLFLAALGDARDRGILGENAAGSGMAFDIELRRGAGAYICGEETALFNSIEGFRGEPRQKPPFPTEAGLFGRPTVVNNVETFANIATIVNGGGEAFARLGTPASTGTKLFCVSGHVAEPGVYEVEFGATLGDLIELAGGTRGELGVVLVGGAAGSFVGNDQLDIPLTFEGARDAGISLGSGAIVAMNTETDFGAIVRRIAAFFRDESCGQCVPCRVGTVRQEEVVVRLTANGRGAASDARLIDDLDRAMRDASICGLGHTASGAVRSAIRLGLVGGSW